MKFLSAALLLGAFAIIRPVDIKLPEATGPVPANAPAQTCAACYSQPIPDAFCRAQCGCGRSAFCGSW